MKQIKWEYKVISHDGYFTLEGLLEDLGVAGWELITYTRSGTIGDPSYELIFKRPKIDSFNMQGLEEPVRLPNRVTDIIEDVTVL